MLHIDQAIDREVGSITKRAYIYLILLYFTVDYIHAPQILLILFCAPPPDAFQYNPHADNNTETILSEWNFTEEQRNWIPGFLQSIFFVGFMIGTVLFGQLADRFGRWNVSWKVYTGCVVASFAEAFTTNWKQLSVCRFLSGLGIGGLSVVNTIILQETCSAKLWVTNGALGGLSFSIISVIMLLFAYFIPSWRVLAIACTFPALLGYIFYFLVPESPRWLVSHNRISEAESSVQRLAKWNGNSGSDYQLLENADTQSSNSTSNSNSKNDTKNSILDLVKYPILRYRTFILILEWFTTSFVFYCLTLGAGSFSPNFYLAFGMSAFSQFPAIPIVLFFMDRPWCGRRGTLSGLMLITSVSMFIMYILPDNDNTAEIRLILSMIAKVGTSGCFNIIYVYTPELYPTVVRNVGLGSMSTFARFGSITAPFVANYTVNSGASGPFLLYGILSGLSGILALSLPETQGKRIINTIGEAHEHEEEYLET